MTPEEFIAKTQRMGSIEASIYPLPHLVPARHARSETAIPPPVGVRYEVFVADHKNEVAARLVVGDVDEVIDLLAAAGRRAETITLLVHNRDTSDRYERIVTELRHRLQWRHPTRVRAVRMTPLPVNVLA